MSGAQCRSPFLVDTRRKECEGVAGDSLVFTSGAGTFIV